MKLENRIRALIAVGASVSANCQPCLQTTSSMARDAGADEAQIAEAIEVGKRVRQGAASKMDKFASSLDYAALSASAANDGCGCGS